MAPRNAPAPDSELIFFDTNEVRNPGPRRIHAAWREVHGRHVWLPPTVVTELMPRTGAVYIDGHPQAASEDMERHWDNSEKDVQGRIRSEVWWEGVLNDPESPYRTRPLTKEQRALRNEILERIDAKGFPNVVPDSIPHQKDAQLIAETIVLGGRLLLTSNMRSISHKHVNEWSREHGRDYGGGDHDVIANTDTMLCHWLKTRQADDRILQAALLAASDDTETATKNPLEWIQHCIDVMRRITRDPSHQLHGFGTLLTTELAKHPDPAWLAALAAAKLPSATIETDRQHPSHPSRREDHTERAERPEPYQQVETRTPGPSR